MKFIINNSLQGILCVLMLLTFAGCAHTATDPESGISGSSVNGISVFKGIPYAQAPVGNLRWKAPQALTNLEKDFDALNFGSICPQPKERANSPDLTQSEDCLTLNIWTADQKPQKPKPVMVWIHGGGFQFGSGQDSRTEASRLAAKDVVVVTFNYRLGVLGRFAHPSLSEEQHNAPRANYGLMDQVMALKWVQKNITEFGGDPDNVTIFGNSAGAVSVNFLLASPASKGLFRRAIAQSSAVLIPRSRHISEQVGALQPLEQEGLELAGQLGIANDTATMSKLRKISVEQLMTLKRPMNSTNPVVDGNFIVEDLGASFKNGRVHPVDYMSGVVSWEASLAMAMQNIPDSVFMGVMSSTYGFEIDKLKAQYQGSATMKQDMFADSFHASTLYLAKSMAQRGANSYLYWFNYLPKSVVDIPGVPHSGEVPYVFGNLEQRTKTGTSEVTDLDREVSDRIQSYWVNFARNGNPNNADLPDWPKLQKGESTWMKIGENSAVEKDLLKDRMTFWLDSYQKHSK